MYTSGVPIYSAAVLELTLGDKKYDLLYDAGVTNNLGKVVVLLDACVNPDTPAPRRNGETPLHGAAKKGNVAVALHMLAAKADPMRGDNGGKSPLWHAAKTCEYLALMMLGHSDKLPKKSVLPRAIKYGHFNLAKELLERGAEAGSKDYISVSRALEKGREDIARRVLKQADSEDILWAAVEESDKAVVKFCLEEGVDPDARENVCEMTPLHRAAEVGSKRVVRALIRGGAEINAIYRERQKKRNYQWTPLTLAASEGHEKVVKYLLNHDASIEFGESPLLHALKEHHFSIAKRLLDEGAEMEDLVEGVVSLYDWFSCGKGQDDKVREFLDKYCNEHPYKHAYYYESSEDAETEEIDIEGLPSVSNEDSQTTQVDSDDGSHELDFDFEPLMNSEDTDLFVPPSEGAEATEVEWDSDVVLYPETTSDYGSYEPGSDYSGSSAYHSGEPGDDSSEYLS